MCGGCDDRLLDPRIYGKKNGAAKIYISIASRMLSFFKSRWGAIDIKKAKLNDSWRIRNYSFNPYCLSLIQICVDIV
jgi:hypothetical protein